MPRVQIFSHFELNVKLVLHTEGEGYMSTHSESKSTSAFKDSSRATDPGRLDFSSIYVLLLNKVSRAQASI